MNEFLTSLKNYGQKGVSLVQILMTSSAIAGLALVGLRMAEDQKKLVEETYETYLSQYFLEEINNILDSKENCTLTFEGVNPLESKVGTLKAKRSEEVVSIFPVEGTEGAKGSYFEDRIKLLGYELKSKDPERSREKGITELIVTMVLKNSSKKLMKSIPIDFKSNETGALASCSRQMSTAAKELKGYWKKEAGNLTLDGLSLIVGVGTKKSSLFHLNGSLFLEKTRNDLPCTEENEGVLSTSYQNFLKYCQDGEWKIVGQYPINWEKKKRYSEVIAASGTNRKRTEPHRLCYLVGQSRKSLSDKCRLERINDEYKSEYEIQAVTSSLVTRNECEVICVD